MAERRTTVVAKEEDLVMVAREAQAQGLTLGRMLGQLVAERADQLREGARPRLGTFRSDVGSVAALMKEEQAARPFRSS
jgi:hypothetical protein